MQHIYIYIYIYTVYICRINLRILEVHGNEIALCKLSDGTVQLCSCAP